MTVDVTIYDDGRVIATHNSGRVLWVCDVDLDTLDDKYRADEQLSRSVEDLFDDF